MRIISGRAKGQRLKGPPRGSVRPTSDLVRGAIFDILASLKGEWARVLDLYAGTGALGIEALSRGALHADFVERNRACCAVIRENLRRTGLEEQGRVYCLEVARALRILQNGYDLVFADPPYGDPGLGLVLERLGHSHLLADGVAVVEHSYRFPLAESYGPLKIVNQRRHGDTCISFYEAGRVVP